MCVFSQSPRHKKFYERQIIMQLKFKKVRQTLVITLGGDLDHHNAASVREEIDRKFSDSKAKNLVFNLSKLQFMDSSGLGILIGRYKSVSAIGGKAAIISPSHTAKRLITLAGLHKIIPIYENLEDALGGAV